MAGAGIAQDTNLEIYNETNTNKRICFYDAADKVAMIAFRCETVRARSTTMTNINNVDFIIRVFEYGLHELYSYTEKSNIERIEIGPKSANFTTRKIKLPAPDTTTRYILKVCNKSRPEKIDFVVAFATDWGQPHFTYGWWSVEKDKCLDFPVSTMLKADWNIPYGTKPYVYYFGRITVPQPLIWEGTATSCMDVNNVFKVKVSTLNFDHKKWSEQCSLVGPTLTKVGMRPLDRPIGKDLVFSLNF
jgi:Protein of unknown function (DUF1036)